jgi:pimeloyl-ACP methyl ester carboxylesterase
MVTQRLIAVFCATTLATLTAQDHSVPALPRFEVAPCPFQADDAILKQIRCGYVEVPENRAISKGLRLKLSVAILKSFSADPRPDPVVILAGGPGSPLVSAAPGVALHGSLEGDVANQMVAKALIQTLRADRDVIFYDQRGVGFSEPEMCPEEATNWGPRPPEGPAGRRARMRQVATRCGDSMRRAGLDLAQYNSAVSARDLQDLRRALGYEHWNLFGHSYGSRLALVAMRDAPQGIRSVVISGLYPPNVASWFNQPAWVFDVLHRVSAACAAQPACDAAFPEVEDTLWRTVDQLNRVPWTRQLPRRNGRVDSFTTTGTTFTARLAPMLRTPTGLSTIPMLVHAMRGRDEAVLNALLRQPAEDDEPVSRALHLSVQCFEELPLNTAELRERTRRAYPPELLDRNVFSDPRLCEGLHSFRARPEHAVLADSDIPTLIVTGEFDPTTHRSNGPIAQRSLKNSQLADVPGAGHSGAFDHDCTRTMARDFLNAPSEKRNMSCLRAIPPLRFVTDVKAIPR